MVLDEQQSETVKAAAIESLYAGGQTWAATVLQRSRCEFIDIESPMPRIGETRLKKLKAQLFIQDRSDIDPQSLSDDTLIKYVMSGLNDALEDKVSTKEEFLHVYELSLEFEIGNAGSSGDVPGGPADDKTSDSLKLKAWDGLNLRSGAEMMIAKALDRERVMFFHRCHARLNARDGRAIIEVGFLVCSNGKWGMLEIDYRDESSSFRDYTRDRLFRLNGVRAIEHFSADECKGDPHDVVREFLDLLSKS
jgi:hypothetical protein